jgi:hypothetical protein
LVDRSRIALKILRGAVMRFRWILILTLSLSPMGAFAEDISSTFRDGIFGVPWGVPLDSVIGMFPEGDSVPLGIAGYQGFWVKDGQTFLGVVRERNGVLYGVDDRDGVSVAAIAFPYNRKEELLAALTQMFGPPTTNAITKPGKVRLGWASKGSLRASITDDNTTQHPMLWLTIGTATYAAAAASSKCNVGSVVAHP